MHPLLTKILDPPLCLAHVNRKKKGVYVKSKTHFGLSASMAPRKPFREIILANNYPM